MDPKTGAVAVIPKEASTIFSGPHVMTSEEVKKDPRFLARQEIARRAQENRSEEEKAFAPDILNEDGTITPGTPETEAPAVEEHETEGEQPAQETPAEEPEVEPTNEATPEPEEERELIIDGKTVRVPISKILDAGVRTYQKETTADQRLATATELLQAATARAQQPSTDVETRIEQPPAGQPSQEDAALAHAIQFGTEEEARTAIAKLRTAGRGMSDNQLQDFVQKNVTAAIPEQIAFHTANQRIRSDYKEIFSDPDFEQHFMLQETKARQGGDRRPYDELYKDIAEKMVTKFKLRRAEVSQPAGEPISGRIARKAAAPRAAQSASAPIVREGGEPKRAPTVADYVTAQRHRRGLQPLPRQ